MATRTVRLDDEAEAALTEIRKATGLPISEALKQGLHVLQERVSQEARRTPWEIYKDLDLGPGGRVTNKRLVPRQTRRRPAMTFQSSVPP